MIVGSGHEISIKDLALLIKEITAINGELVFDDTKPDGTPRKLMDDSLIRSVGWKPQIDLPQGLKQVIESWDHLEVKES